MKDGFMKIAIAQLNPTVGDVFGNLQKALDALAESQKNAADLVVFPELFITGYPPRDLLERAGFLDNTAQALAALTEKTKIFPGLGVIIGAPLPTSGKTTRRLYNSAQLIHNGRVLLTQHKTLLPMYDVFDEQRYFEPATESGVAGFKGETLGICICEDAWNEPGLVTHTAYPCDPVAKLAGLGASLIVNISASPFYAGKDELRFRLISRHAEKQNLPFVFVNQVGGNDELVFDGKSMVIGKNGAPLSVLPSFQEAITTVDTSQTIEDKSYIPEDRVAGMYNALVLGVKDYMRKTGFNQAVIGLSGGIDSAVCCCIATGALGSANVLGISLPGPYSSRGSVEDSRALANALDIPFKVIDITPVYEQFLQILAPHFQGVAPDTTEENLQARIRASVLMAFSNKFGHLLLTTGNKSEIAVGYCTLYGDMAGGLAVISDVPKTAVYRLADYVNRDTEIIPKATILKPPSAELKPDQKDQDTLPPYDILDAILEAYIDKGCSLQQIIEQGMDAETVRWVISTIDKNEYKRRQAAPGLKVTSKAFGTGRRMAIAAKHNVI